MSKARINLSITQEAYDYLRAMAGSERKMGETVSALIMEVVKNNNMTEAEIYNEMAKLYKRLGEVRG